MYPLYGYTLYGVEIMVLQIISSCANLLVFAAFVLTPIIGGFIYKQGGFATLHYAYPKLWRYGLVSMFLCGLSRLIQSLESWIGLKELAVLNVSVIALTGIIASIFVRLLWISRNEIIKVARIIRRAIDEAEGRGTHGL